MFKAYDFEAPSCFDGLIFFGVLSRFFPAQGQRHRGAKDDTVTSGADLAIRLESGHAAPTQFGHNTNRWDKNDNEAPITD